MKKEASIPLRSPDGVVYAWACGVCHHVDGGREMLVRLSPEDVAGFAEDSRAGADRCCTCHSCGTRQPRDVGLGTRCAACAEKERPAEEARHARILAENATFMARANASLARSPDCDAAVCLNAFMSGISNEYYCAGWLIGLEFVLWDILQDPDRREVGFGVVPDDEVARLRELHEKAGGWWRWETDEGTICAGGEVFVTTEEWKAILAARGMGQ